MSVSKKRFSTGIVACTLAIVANPALAQSPSSTVLLVIDKDSIEYGLEQYQVPPDALNDLIAAVGVRDPLPFFASNIGGQFNLRTRLAGNDSWFGLRSVPPTWVSDGGANDGLENYALAGPGLGSPDRNGDRESLLDPVSEVAPIRVAEASMLLGRTVCAVLYAADLGAGADASPMSLKGPNLGIMAFRVLRLASASAESPTVTVEILDAREGCSEALEVLPTQP